MEFWKEIRATFRNSDNLMKLIYLNVALFLIITLIGVVGFLVVSPEMVNQTIRFLSVPSSIQTLILKPWTLITYMFTHKELLHILVNLLWLYWFGKIFLEYLDQKKLVAVYLLGGIAGGFTYVLAYNIFPAFRGVVGESIPLLGASASVMAIVVAISAYVPDYTVYLFLLGRIKIKYIALGIFIFTSLMDISVNSGGKLAHIGGALMGYLYIVSFRQGHDIGKGINKAIDFFVTLFKPRKKLKVTYKKAADDFEYNKIKIDHQKEINKILDKISKGGYDSLTKAEKEILFRESQKKD
jgi:membrane associated rhomboid family serine protease